MDLTDYISTLEEQLADTAVIISASKTADGKGGERTTLTQGPTYPCNVQQNQQPFERQLGDKNQEESGWLVFLPHDAIVNRKDRIQIGTSTFEVLGTNLGESNRMLTMATCRRMS